MLFGHFDTEPNRLCKSLVFEAAAVVIFLSMKSFLNFFFLSAKEQYDIFFRGEGHELFLFTEGSMIGLLGEGLFSSQIHDSLYLFREVPGYNSVYCHFK